MILGDFLTHRDKIAELEKQVAELKRENERLVSRPYFEAVATPTPAAGPIAERLFICMQKEMMPMLKAHVFQALTSLPFDKMANEARMYEAVSRYSRDTPYPDSMPVRQFRLQIPSTNCDISMMIANQVFDESATPRHYR